jgi:hypothetical protein
MELEFVKGACAHEAAINNHNYNPGANQAFTEAAIGKRACGMPTCRVTAGEVAQVVAALNEDAPNKVILDRITATNCRGAFKKLIGRALKK